MTFFHTLTASRCRRAASVRRIAALGQLLIDRFDIVVPLGVGEHGGLHQQSLEPDEDLPCQYLEPPFSLVARIDGLDRIGEPLDAGKALRADQRYGIEAESAQMRLGRLDGFQ